MYEGNPEEIDFGSSYRKSTVRCKDLTLKIFKTNHETKVSNSGEYIGIKACFFQNTDGSQNFLLYEHSLQNRHCFFEFYGHAKHEEVR